MSLINQMLRDLDQRQASTLERAGLAAQVRALPAEKSFPWLRLVPAVSGLVLGAAGLWLFVQARQAPATPAAAMTAASAVTMPVLAVPMPVEPVAEPPATSALQMDFQLRRTEVRRAEAPAPVSSEPPAAVPQPPAIDKRPAGSTMNTADAEYAKGMASYRQGRPNEAVEAFQAALRLDPRHVSARQALLSLLMEQRRWQEAQAAAAEGLALVPAQPGWAMILARLQVEQGQVAEAEQTMAAHARYAERSAEYQAFYGLLLDKLQRPQEAREAFQKARDLGSLPPSQAAAVETRLR
ncbi:MAG TPA: tetratricopeptide repeat protein [Rhodocyclaceae bacterium]|nr:tetratricopeptide repeat protein [Rhodocyclaceae bacterium]